MLIAVPIPPTRWTCRWKIEIETVNNQVFPSVFSLFFLFSSLIFSFLFFFFANTTAAWLTWINEGQDTWRFCFQLLLSTRHLATWKLIGRSAITGQWSMDQITKTASQARGSNKWSQMSQSHSKSHLAIWPRRSLHCSSRPLEVMERLIDGKSCAVPVSKVGQ